MISISRLLSVTAALAAAMPALAQDGIKLPAGQTAWSAAADRLGWPGSLRVSATVVETQTYGPAAAAWAWPGMRAAGGATLIGDYYFYAAGEPSSWRSGLRASSGLLIRQAGSSYADLALSSRGSGTAALRALPSGAAAFGSEAAGDGYRALPYLGLGYSTPAARSGWGFWADVGVLVQSPGGAVGVTRLLSGSQGADDVIRELRLAPMLQLGVNYAF